MATTSPRRTSKTATASAVGLALCALVLVPAGTATAQPLEFEEAWVRIEINTTDGDAGFQGMVDGEEWRRVSLIDPSQMRIYRVSGAGSVREQGLTENFFESAEPDCEEQPLADFLELFPAGEYTFRGKTTDNAPISAEAWLTHALPGAPENLSPSGGGVDANAGVTITWTPGDTLGNCPPNGAELDADPGDVPLFGWQVVVDREVPEPLLVMSVDLPPNVTALTLPSQTLQQNAIYKYEIIAIEARLNDDDEEERGNQVLSEGFFCTLGVAPCELD